MYLLGSHNSWSFSKPKKCYMSLFKFVARCQDKNIKEQYEDYGVRCFDLRVRFDKKGRMVIAHGLMEYDISERQIHDDLEYINSKGDCYVRMIHEVRKEKDYTDISIKKFKEFCANVESEYKNIKFWCGQNLYNRVRDYTFQQKPSCEEKYSSVCPPKILDDWYPRVYALLNNKKNLEKGTDKAIFLIDFVNIK